MGAGWQRIVATSPHKQCCSVQRLKLMQTGNQPGIKAESEADAFVRIDWLR